MGPSTTAATGEEGILCKLAVEGPRIRRHSGLTFGEGDHSGRGRMRGGRGVGEPREGFVALSDRRLVNWRRPSPEPWSYHVTLAIGFEHHLG